MQSKFINNQKLSCSELTDRRSDFLPNTDTIVEQKPFLFQVGFSGCMDMYSDAETVANYLNVHEDWFCHCAQPMKVVPLANNGYILTIGKFGSFGYEVEPKIALVLAPPENRVYTIYTVPVPDYEPPGYAVDYQAEMELMEVSTASIVAPLPKFSASVPSAVTQVRWKLDLAVTVKFPKFIYRLPNSLIQTTGDRVLSQIVKQISPRLTYKVQQDFHLRHNLPVPNKQGRKFAMITATDN